MTDDMSIVFERANKIARSIHQAFITFCDSGDRDKIIIANTEEKGTGVSYSVELLPNATYWIWESRDLDRDYISPGVMIPIPTISDSDFEPEYPEISDFVHAEDTLYLHYLQIADEFQGNKLPSDFDPDDLLAETDFSEPPFILNRDPSYRERKPHAKKKRKKNRARKRNRR